MGMSQTHREELTEAFKTFDLDQDGQITRTELSSALRQLGFEASDAEVDSMMQEADCDGDGNISLEEFLRINEIALSLEHGDSAQILKEVFEVFDSNQNGVICADELHRALTNLCPDGKPVTMEDCRRMIANVDSNGDGVIDFPEFHSMMTAQDGIMPC